MAFDIGPLRAVVRAVNFDIFGVDVTITPPAPDDRTETRAVWMNGPTVEQPSGLNLSRADLRFLMAFRRDLQPTLKRGTRVWARINPDSDVRGWRIDGFDRIEALIVVVVLVPDDSEMPDA